MRVFMKIGVALLGLAGSATFGAFNQPLSAVARPQAAASKPAQSSPGLFTEKQAKRGEVLYLAECGRCHGEALTGTESGPPLLGDAFLEVWSKVPLGNLFDKIQDEMPQDSPGRLTRPQTADILAHMLSVDKFPEGTVELTSDAVALKKMRLQR